MTQLARAALAVVFLVLGGGWAAAEDSWRQGPPIPEGANEVIGATVAGQVLVYGGQDGTSKPMGIFWKFEPASGQWAKLPSNPMPVHHGAAVGIGRRFYVFGGFRLPESGKSNWYPVNNAWMFDLDSQSWTALPAMPTPRGALAAEAVGSKIYVIGGARLPRRLHTPDRLYGGGPARPLGTQPELCTVSHNTPGSQAASAPR